MSELRSFRCQGCGSVEKTESIVAREMMFGTRQEFEYDLCGACGSLQIATLLSPKELSRHYPSNYYSMNAPPRRRYATLRHALRRRLDAHLLGTLDPIGWLLAHSMPVPNIIEILGQMGVRRSQSVIDVGSGSQAQLLLRLEESGFTDLTGVDPLIPSNKRVSRHVHLVKSNVAGLQGLFDVIIFNHSFEHIADPRDTFAQISRLLAPSGVAIIRTPTTSSAAFLNYRANWVQIDAPRHLFIPSRRVMEHLASSAQLTLEKTIDDSTGFQFTGSEMYSHDVAMTERPKKAFTRLQKARYRRKAKGLNRYGLGDQAAFIIVRAERGQGACGS